MALERVTLIRGDMAEYVAAALAGAWSEPVLEVHCCALARVQTATVTKVSDDYSDIDLTRLAVFDHDKLYTAQ